MDLSNDPVFRMSQMAEGRRLHICLEGELDMAKAGSVSELVETLQDRYDEVVFDLARLTFIDSSGLNALVKLRRAGVPMSLRGASPSVRRVIDIGGLTEFLNVS